MEFLLVIVYLFLFEAIILCQEKLSHREFTRKVKFLQDRAMNETNYRRKVYLKNMAIIKEHNEKFKKGLVSYSMKMNQFGHLTDEEFKNLYAVSFVENEESFKKDYDIYYAPKNLALPATVDWRKKGAVAPIKSQRGCSSCYAFATISAIESQYFIKNKILVPFSEQQVMDCSNSKTNNGTGCRGGGYAFKVYRYARNVGLTSDKSYPYESKYGPCRIKNHKILVKLRGYKKVSSSVYDMEAAIAFKGPASAGINSTKLKFASGAEILTGNWCGSKRQITHFVTVVGYNKTKKGQKYWIIRNSWGKGWGNKGYFFVERHKDDLCGIAQEAFFPELD